MTGAGESLPAAVDVLVAGSGAAGLTAALTAAANGASVLIAEAGTQLGGTTALSFGRTWVPASHLSADDSPEAALVYLSGLFSDRYPDMTEAFVRTAPVMARYVEQHTPLRFTACASYPDYHQSRPGARQGGRALDIMPIELTALTPHARQVRRPPGYLPLTHADWESWRYPRFYDWALLEQRQRKGILAGGTGLAAGLLDGAVRAGARVLDRTRLTGVRVDASGAVQAADLEHEGQAGTLSAGAVILATGGFDRDDQMRARMLPEPVTATGAAPDNTGDTLRIAASRGAQSENLPEGWWMPMIAIPGRQIDGKPYFQSLIRERALPRQILVNGAARRFVNEALPYHELSKAMHRRGPGGAFPNAAAWMIFDEGFRGSFGVPATAPGQPLPPWVTITPSACWPAR